MKRIFLSWAAYPTRCQILADYFEAENIQIFPFASKGDMLKTIARYFLSFFKTCLVLIQHRPAVIFTLNQPAPLVLTIYLFTKLVGGAYILDSHSAPFNDPKLRWLLPAYRFFASKALLNINTNSYHQKLVESWGGKSIIISDIPIEFNLKLPSVKVSPKSIAYVASFDFDEPLQEVIAAAPCARMVS